MLFEQCRDGQREIERWRVKKPEQAKDKTEMGKRQENRKKTPPTPRMMMV
jgi:hypothetical protein